MANQLPVGGGPLLNLAAVSHTYLVCLLHPCFVFAHDNKNNSNNIPTSACERGAAPPCVRTSLTQSLVDEVGRRAKVGSQVEVSAVGRRDAVILEAHVAVELRPRVDVLRPVGCVQHVRYPQIGQQGLLLCRGAATENRISGTSSCGSLLRLPLCYRPPGSKMAAQSFQWNFEKVNFE